MREYAVMPLQDYINTCDNIREKTSTTENIKSGDLPEKVNAVYKAGQKAEYDRFWDSYQDNGNRKDYPYTFGYTWNDDIYNPKYPITATNSAYMFRYTKITDTKVDISANIYNYVFEYAQQLKTIRKLIVSEGATFVSTFRNCIELENIIFEGVIGTDISFKDSKLLSHDSLMSIINALKDFSGTTTTKTLTLHGNSKALLTDSEKAIATQKGWTIA